jgi:DNA-binding transcriptional regulator YhcF (GntR family)
MSRRGEVKQRVLEQLADGGGATRSVRELAADDTRAAIEATRRAAKLLEAEGLVTLSLRPGAVRAQYYELVAQLTPAGAAAVGTH